ncbi:hypothetical protein QF046_002907 [Microbacterium sp. W4I4]|uniref:hypothetical protein n=1 Tax=Microbacterium sp. W4I4 TaxID=3042295 RepID=UPI002785FC9B|nr:hypothetical protein [Microbacterium sp. W4I4]MDQ0615266.1 hypothetical protein [Microbacterium sp. W4I4]
MQLTSNDLASGLSTLALWLAIAGLVVGFSIWRARRHGSRTLALDVTRNASLAYIGLAAFGAVMSAFSQLASGSVALDDDVRQRITEQQDWLLSPACDADGAYPVDPEPVGGPEPMIYCQGWIDNIPLGPRLVIYLGTLLGLAASAAIAWAIHTATRRAGMREPFHPTVFRTFGVTSIAVMAGGALSGIATSVGMTLAARSLEWSDDVQIPFMLSIPVWPFAVAVGLFALSAIFRYGAVLQRETEGLV